MLLYHPLFIVVMIIAAGVGLCLGYVGQRIATRRKRRASEERVRQVLQDAEREAESKIREALLEANDSWYETKARLEQDADATKLELQRLEKKILLREESLERKIEHLEEKEHGLQRRDHSLVEREELYARKEQELATLLATQLRTLEQVAHMTATEAKQQLIDRMLTEARFEGAEKVRRI